MYQLPLQKIIQSTILYAILTSISGIKTTIYTVLGTENMTENDWISFKKASEDLFKSAVVNRDNIYGFQIQKDTKWNNGLDINEIENLENHFGFKFPYDYIEMLKCFNGFETLQISVDPEGKEPDEFGRIYYQYPVDIQKTEWLIDDVKFHIKYAKECLTKEGFDSSQIEGFVPLYGHRALVVLKDKTKSPVLSIWGNDIVLYGKNLMDYMCKEFGLELIE